MRSRNGSAKSRHSPEPLEANGSDMRGYRRLDGGEEKPRVPRSPNVLPIVVVSALSALLFIAFGFLHYYLPSATRCRDHHPYNGTQLGTPRVLDDGRIAYRIVVVTDLDHGSKVNDKNWQSIFKKGSLLLNSDYNSAQVVWDDESQNTVLTSQFAAGGRSMELSDLVVFDGHLLSVDDRTGIVYRIVNFKKAIPWVFLNDGPGDTAKGFKAEWMAVKDQQLFVGGLGKEWTTETGEFVNHNPMYVKVVTNTGEVEHVDWIENYKSLRRALGIEWPGYMIHESAQWSDIHNRWFFLPRRVSKEPYSETEDEFRGSNVLLVADSQFSHIETKEIGEKGDGSRGFSAFQFLPGSNDDIIVALKSQEKDGVAVASYLVMFSLSSGKVLLPEQALNGAYKFEGIAFV